jgi:hypothetical protein
MEGADAERGTFAGAIALGVEPLGGVLDPERWSSIDTCSPSAPMAKI